MRKYLLSFGIGVGVLALIGGALWFVQYAKNRQETGVFVSPSPNVDIVVDTPQLNATVASPIKISGRARGSWFFEASFPAMLETKTGGIVARTPARALGDWMTSDFVPFEATLSYTVATDTAMTLVLKKDNPSGIPEKDASRTIPVIVQGVPTAAVKLYFANTIFDPERLDCTKLFSVTRLIPKTTTVARAALEQLLLGPTPAEQDQGYFTGIDQGVRLNSVAIKNGVAYADFTDIPDGGSCRVVTIARQIENTLKQFPTIKNVVISLNGKTENILQP